MAIVSFFTSIFRAWQGLKSLTKIRKALIRGEEKEIEVLEEEVLEAMQMPLFYTSIPAYCQQNAWSKQLNNRIVQEEGIRFWKKEPSFLESNENAEYDAPGKMNMKYLDRPIGSSVF